MIAVDDYVMDVLMRDLVGHDRAPSAFLVYLHMWAESEGRKRDAVRASHQTIAETIGLSKSAVQKGVSHLVRQAAAQSAQGFGDGDAGISRATPLAAIIGVKCLIYGADGNIRDFLAQKRFAFIGVSRQPKDFSRALFPRIPSRGYEPVPVHPEVGARSRASPASRGLRTSSRRWRQCC